MTPSSEHARGAVAVVLALAAGLGCLLSLRAVAEEPPRLAIELLAPARNLPQEDLDQLVAINAELNDLEEKQRLPGIEIEADRWPEKEFTFGLFDLVMDNDPEELMLTARYEGPDGSPDDPTGRFIEPCTAVHRRAGVRCEPASVENRAAAVVADLFHQTLAHSSHGLYRPFSVVRCDKRSGSRSVRMEVSSTSIVESYQEPASWFAYRPAVLDDPTSIIDPEPVDVLLVRRPKDSEGFFVFLRRDGTMDVLDPYCLRDGDEDRGSAGVVEIREVPKIVLEHRYPGEYRLLRTVPPVVIGINSSAPPAWEEP